MQITYRDNRSSIRAAAIVLAALPALLLGGMGGFALRSSLSDHAVSAAPGRVARPSASVSVQSAPTVSIPETGGRHR